MITKETYNSIDVKSKVLEKIESGQVKMTPKLYFYFKIAVALAMIFSALLLSSFLISYIIYSLRIGGRIYLLSYGARGIYEFFMIFPWFVLVIDILILFFIDWLMKGFSFGYKSSIIFLFLGTFVLITVLGSLINFTIFNRAMMFRAEYNNLPVLSSYYDGIRRSHSRSGVFRGFIKSVGEGSFILVHDDYDDDTIDGQIMVILPPNSNISGIIKVGDEVFVAGDISTTSQIWAYGVSKITKLD